jgi:uncharacterized repeat protein (TIGR03803 family)
MLGFGVVSSPAALAQTYTESVLHSFCSKVNKKTGVCTDGELPLSGLILDSKDNLYGMTSFGGKDNLGTVFKVTKAGKESVLYPFAGAPKDGEAPGDYDNLILDFKGNLYGTTELGGNGSCGGIGCGVIFEVSGKAEKVLYNFQGGTDGSFPEGGLLLDTTTGNLYGTTVGGGANNDGTVFVFDPSSGIKTTLYNFCSKAACADGGGPNGSLVTDASGNLYGTTLGGGSNLLGTVFKVDTSGHETVLHSFTGSPDGASPNGSLVMDANDNLYGTTSAGGSNLVGTVFKVETSGAGYQVLHPFTGPPDGEFPYAGLIIDSEDNLYGTTFGGGQNDLGAVFKVDTNDNETVLWSFGSLALGAEPYGSLAMDTKGNLYGTTELGGANGYGTIFKLTP